MDIVLMCVLYSMLQILNQDHTKLFTNNYKSHELVLLTSGSILIWYCELKANFQSQVLVPLSIVRVPLMSGSVRTVGAHCLVLRSTVKVQ